MRIFILSNGADTAGIGYATTAAFRRHAPDWTVDAMCAGKNYIQYPEDHPWNQRDLERLYDSADVVHIHNILYAHENYDRGQGKPTVLMHHGRGSGSGQSLSEMVAAAKRIGAVQVGSTLDLSILEPRVEWLPAPVNLAEMRRTRGAALRHSSMIRIGHAPTNRAIKGSDAFDAAVRTLQAEALRVQPVLIEKMTWRQCLALKATCDLFWDQPVLGYGSNAVEAWAMGIPVVSGVADPNIRAGMIERWGRLPFLEANEETLTDALRALVTDAALRAEYAAIGTAHVERWHDERVTVENLRRIYSTARPTTPGGQGKRLRRMVIPGRPVVRCR